MSNVKTQLNVSFTRVAGGQLLNLQIVMMAGGFHSPPDNNCALMLATLLGRYATKDSEVVGQCLSVGVDTQWVYLMV